MPPDIQWFATFELRVQERELYKCGRRVRLQGKPFDLLCLLAANPGQLVTRRRLEDALWPDCVYGDFDRSLNSAVNRLRFALGDSAQSPRFIETVPTHGYRFICPLRPETGAVSPNATTDTRLSGRPSEHASGAGFGRQVALALAGLAAISVGVWIPTARSKPIDAAEESTVLGATDAYLKGRALWQRKERTALLKSRDYYLTAIARDPGFALAWTGLADTYNFMGGIGLLDRHEAFDRATESARKALTISPGLGAAYASLAEARFRLGPDDEQVEPLFQRASVLDPDYSLGRYWYGMYLASRHRYDEALEHLWVARDAEPLNVRFQADLGVVLQLADEPDRARRLIDEAVALGPNSQKAHLAAAWLARQMGQSEQAAAAFSRVVELSEDAPLYATELERLVGDPAANVEALRELALRSIRCPEHYKLPSSARAEL